MTLTEKLMTAQDDIFDYIKNLLSKLAGDKAAFIVITFDNDSKLEDIRYVYSYLAKKDRVINSLETVIEAIKNPKPKGIDQLKHQDNTSNLLH